MGVKESLHLGKALFLGILKGAEDETPGMSAGNESQPQSEDVCLAPARRRNPCTDLCRCSCEAGGAKVFAVESCSLNCTPQHCAELRRNEPNATATAYTAECVGGSATKEHAVVSVFIIVVSLLLLAASLQPFITRKLRQRSALLQRLFGRRFGGYGTAEAVLAVSGEPARRNLHSSSEERIEGLEEEGRSLFAVQDGHAVWQ